jgi:hypothetical protein
MQSYRRNIFTTDGEHSYRGFHNPSEEWNGFACPVFKREVVEQMFKELKFTEDLRWHGDNLEYIVDGEIAPITVECVTIEVGGLKMKVYPIGAYCWAWIGRHPKLIKS